MVEMIYAVAGLLLGSLVTLLVADVYYRRAGAELRDESARLRKLITLVLRALEEAGLVRLARNANGDITGLNFVVSVDERVSASDSTEATVHPARSEQPTDPAQPSEEDMKRAPCPICNADAETGPSTGDFELFICPTCGGFRIAGTALTLLRNGTLTKPTPKRFAEIVREKRGTSTEYPIITQHDLGG